MSTFGYKPRKFYAAEKEKGAGAPFFYIELSRHENYKYKDYWLASRAAAVPM